MDESTLNALIALRSDDQAAQNEAFNRILAQTDRPVPWAYEAWDGLLADLRHKDNHVRAIACHTTSNWNASYTGAHPNCGEGNCFGHGGASCRDCHTVNLLTATCTKCHDSNSPGGGDRNGGGGNDIPLNPRFP